jgi:hypothetical protein
MPRVADVCRASSIASHRIASIGRSVGRSTSTTRDRIECMMHEWMTDGRWTTHRDDGERRNDATRRESDATTNDARRGARARRGRRGVRDGANDANDGTERRFVSRKRRDATKDDSNGTARDDEGKD